MKRVLLVLTAYIALAAVLWFGLGSLNIPTYRRLAAESVQGEATITITTCEQHSTVSYTFDAGGGQVRRFPPAGVMSRHLEVVSQPAII